jgi:hypothetical protein
MHNEFEGRSETVLVTYDDVIKTPYPFLLNKIDTKLRSFYEAFLDVDKFKGLDMNNLLRLCVQRTDRHLFRYLAKTDFDFDGALKELQDRYFEIYEQSPLLAMGDGIQMMLTQKFTNKIYIYTEVYDIRVHLDIQKTFNDMERVNYITGDFPSVLNKLDGITSYIVNDLDYVIDIINSGKTEFTNIMLAQYGYNYALDDDTQTLEFRMNLSDLIGDRVCKLGTFMPVNFTEKHFSQLTSNV